MPSYPAQFLAQLAKATDLATIYCISSESPLLQRELSNALWEKAKSLGFTHKCPYFVDTQFSWLDLLNQSQQRSLFSERPFIVVYTGNKISAEGVKFVVSYTEKPPADQILLIITDKLDAAQKKARWLAAIEKKGLWIEAPIPRFEAFTQAIKQRLQENHLAIEQDSLHLIQEYCAGNIDAVAQLIEQMRLAYQSGFIEKEKIVSLLSNHSQHTVFDAIDAALSQQPKHAIAIIQSLMQENAIQPLVLWAATYKLRLLLQYLQEKTTIRDRTIQKTAKYFSITHCWQLLAMAHDIDRKIKSFDTLLAEQALLRFYFLIATAERYENAKNRV